MRTGHPPEALRAIEQALARHSAFGDSSYIFGQLQAAMEHRLRTLAHRMPTAGQLLEALEAHKAKPLYHVIGDTVVRCAIIHAHTQLIRGAPFGLPLEDCEEVFAATARRLERGEFGTTLNDGSLRRLGSEPYHGWIWSDEHSNDIFGRAFRYLLKHRYDAQPVTPTSGEYTMLATGARLLGELLPALAPSALSHAHVIACVPSAGGWKGIASSSQFHLGGTIFLHGPAMSSPWWVAEHVLHEALHQKLYDFRHGHSLLTLDGAGENAPKVLAPWNPPRLIKSNQWDVHRVFAAFHVYVHIAFIAIVAEQRAAELESTYGPFCGMIESGKALARAHYLGEQLKERCWDELGPAGQGLLEWLISVLEFLNPAPPPKGADMHLYLDRYDKEAGQIGAALRGRRSGPSNLPQALIPLAKEEAERARQILSAIGAKQELGRFNDAVAKFGDEELGTKFPELRRVIGTALMKASPDGYQLTETGRDDDLVRQMVESASRSVYPLVAGYPPAVAEAKRRATELRFRISCDDDVGRLLSVLAGAVPAGGRVLEIGTGVGVGVAWITEGLGKRTDVEVVSVEVDARLSDAARALAWPAYVQVVNADALEAFATLGTFNLVFADAAPIKYGHIESVLKLLRPGGLLLIDDLETTTRTSEAQRAEKAALLSAVLHHPELHAVNIDWSTGMILASKSASLAL